MVKPSAVSYITCVVGSEKPLPELKKRVLSQAQQLRPANLLGARGERRAVLFLESHGFCVLDTNVQFGRWEIDVVAIDEQVNEVVFVEVKTRSSLDFGHPTEAVGFAKKRALWQAASLYVKAKNLQQDFRFDVVAISPAGVEHFENITW